MDKIIKESIVEIIKANKELLKIPLRQKAKFEGWLKFELANCLEQNGMEDVGVESKGYYRRDRTDVSFFNNGNYYRVELKTCNTNWSIKGVISNSRPITKNIQSIINDAVKLNSTQGIVAFTLFPVPVNDNRWRKYIERISKKTGIEINADNYEIIQLNIDKQNSCNIIVCTFKSKRFRDW
jgi:hypothetical protein